jgi:hypothetical protein
MRKQTYHARVSAQATTEMGEAYFDGTKASLLRGIENKLLREVVSLAGLIGSGETIVTAAGLKIGRIVVD